MKKHQKKPKKKQHPFVFLLFLAFLGIWLMPAYALAQAEKPRHIIVAMDTSKSMWMGIKPNRLRKTALQRLHAVLVEMLFTQDPVLPSQGDSITIPGTIPRPLLRKQDFLTLYFFGKEVTTTFLHQARSSLSERIFREKLPDPLKYWQSMKESFSIIAAAKVNALRDLERYKQESNYFLLVSDDVADSGSPNSEIFTRNQKAQEDLEREQRDKRLHPLFAFRVQGHISLRLYHLQHTEGAKATDTTPSVPVIIKVEPLAQAKVEKDEIIQQVRLKSPTEWNQHQLQSVQYIVSQEGQEATRKPLTINKKLDKQETTLSLAIPKDKVRQHLPFQVVMQLRFLTPDNKPIDKETSFTFPAIVQAAASLPVAKTPEDDDTTALVIILGILLVIFFVISFALYRVFFASTKSISLTVRFESPIGTKQETFHLSKGKKIYLSLRTDGEFFLDINAPDYTLVWQKDQMILQTPTGKEEDIPFLQPYRLLQGHLFLEQHTSESQEDQSL